MEMLSRAPLPGLARGLPADRPARPLLLLRGLHPHRRLDVQPAREVARRPRASSPWRRPIASLNYLLTSHVWRQDHNGFTHQDPGFIDHVVNKKAEVVRVYLPPDANTLLSVADHCLRSRDYVNVIVAGQAAASELADDGRGGAALRPGPRDLGLGRATTRAEPGRGARLRGDVPTLETLAAADILREQLPDAQGARRQRRRPHAAPAARPSTRMACRDRDFDTLFTADKPVIFAYHGYPWLIHRLSYRRTNHDNLHVRGYKEEGTTTTPFDMVMMNDMDRFHLVMDVIDRVPSSACALRAPRQEMVDHPAARPAVDPRPRRRPA